QERSHEDGRDHGSGEANRKVDRERLADAALDQPGIAVHLAKLFDTVELRAIFVAVLRIEVAQSFEVARLVVEGAHDLRIEAEIETRRERTIEKIQRREQRE